MKGDETFEEVQTLTPGQWKVNPSTGVISLTEDALNILLNPDPIENFYVLDPEPIARGQFAIVYHCHHRVTGKEFAAKFSSKVRLGSDCSLDLVHEIAVCAMLKPTSRAVQLVDVFSTNNELVLVMEFAPGGDLQTLLDENLVPYERDVIKFMRQLLEGLVFIHERNIVHLDIKPQNLVLMGEFPDCAVKLCDFEISRMLMPGQEVREILGTPDYVAPEILHYEPITTRTDMWSVGVLTYVLLTGFLPFGGNNDQETFVEILKCELDFPSELFEDITPEAIDFISKLLIRKPEQRMSAKECLNHTWMRSGLKRPTPPSTLKLNSPLTAIMSNESSKPVSLPNTCPDESVKENKQIERLTKTSDCTQLQDLASPARDIGRPPLHPSSSQKSLFGDSTPIAGTPVAIPSFNLTSPFIFRQESRFGSRHNLDKLRSLSKSREVISERVQMSNLKVSLSKSRERLCDARLGMSKSREHLMALSSFSQSVEALSALSHLSQQNNLFQSCNNIYSTKIHEPQHNNNVQGRMYQSMAAIDQIDRINCTKKIGYFESRISLNGEDYNDILTQRNTDMNYFIGDLKFEKSVENKSATGLRGNNCRGGRGGDTCDNRCTRHRQPEAKLTQKIQKISRADKMKKDAQRRRKEKKERERQERLKREKENKERERQKNSCAADTDMLRVKPAERVNQENPSSPSFRRCSVSHVEQRIQERHERNQERLEKQGKEEKKCSRRLSADLDRSHSCEKPKSKSATLGVNNQRPRSITPTRRKSKKESPLESDVSQASSMESVEAITEKTILNLENKHLIIPNFKVETDTEDERNNNTLKENDGEIAEDEAYISLEDSSRDIFLRSKSTESNSSDESDKTVTEVRDDEHSKSSDDELGVETLSVTEKILNFEKGRLVTPQKQSISSNKQKPFTGIEEIVSTSTKHLPIINEESSLSKSSTYPTFNRSLSNTSDLGSLISESSDGSLEREEFPISHLSFPSQTTELLSPDWKSRSRSISVFSNPSPPLSSSGRSRSNSFNLDDIGSARPWGTVCSGSFARAFEKFNLKTSSSQGTPSPTILSPCEENLPVLQ